MDASDAELIALAKREIAQDRPRRRGRRHDGCVVRQPKAYPVYDETIASNVATIRAGPRGALSDAASGRPQRHAQVQQSGPRHDDGHADRAQNILAGERVYDVWNVNEDAEYHEAGRGSEQQALRASGWCRSRVRPAA